MSNFPFSHSVSKRLPLQTGKNQGLFGKGLKWEMSMKSNVHIEGHASYQDINYKTLPKTNFSDCPKLKAFADQKVNMAEKFVLGGVENIVGKG